MRVRRSLSFLCLAVVAVVVSACGSGVVNTTPPNPTAPLTTTTTQATTTHATTTPSSGGSSGSGSSATASVKEGEMIFKSTCGVCHTLAAAGTHGTVGPDLDQKMPNMQCVVQQVTHGGAVMPPCKAVAGAIMPPFGHSLSHVQIESVAKFVSSVAGKGG